MLMHDGADFINFLFDSKLNRPPSKWMDNNALQCQCWCATYDVSLNYVSQNIWPDAYVQFLHNNCSKWKTVKIVCKLMMIYQTKPENA